MTKLSIGILLGASLTILVGCDRPATDITNATPEAKFNPAISPAQRERMMHRGQAPTTTPQPEASRGNGD